MNTNDEYLKELKESGITPEELNDEAYCLVKEAVYSIRQIGAIGGVEQDVVDDVIIGQMLLHASQHSDWA